ncbi:MAG: hypothetical protein GY820_10710 [Gammaproteobacteria bacterium]|nr:hypothetical protein [Gammaproteobacteria bacterium]
MRQKKESMAQSVNIRCGRRRSPTSQVVANFSASRPVCYNVFVRRKGRWKIVPMSKPCRSTGPSRSGRLFGRRRRGTLAPVPILQVEGSSQVLGHAVPTWRFQKM